MDQFADYLALAWQVAAIAGVVVMVASGITALTPTPAPGSRLARVYRCIEIAAVMVGYAKDTGLLPRHQAAERVGAGILGVARDIARK
ncbi:MAG TPA: hypothetical protein VEC60_14195 [Reyranella sp.]|nr:hypothetical protein [Reyranella sp.]